MRLLTNHNPRNTFPLMRTLSNINKLPRYGHRSATGGDALFDNLIPATVRIRCDRASADSAAVCLDPKMPGWWWRTAGDQWHRAMLTPFPSLSVASSPQHFAANRTDEQAARSRVTSPLAGCAPDMKKDSIHVPGRSLPRWQRPPRPHVRYPAATTSPAPCSRASAHSNSEREAGGTLRPRRLDGCGSSVMNSAQENSDCWPGEAGT